MLVWLTARIKEPSTWAGIAGLVGSMTFLPHSQDYATAIPTIGAAVASLLAMAIAETKK